MKSLHWQDVYNINSRRRIHLHSEGNFVKYGSCNQFREFSVAFDLLEQVPALDANVKVVTSKKSRQIESVTVLNTYAVVLMYA